jgi:CheW-like domain.
MEIVKEKESVTEKVVEFAIGDEGFALPVDHVVEILRPGAITPIPRSHPFIEGITEIRGEVLPVIDLACALGLEGRRDDDARFIVCEFGKDRVIFHVDRVVQLTEVISSEEPGNLDEYRYLEAVLKTKNRMLLLLNYEKLLERIRS